MTTLTHKRLLDVKGVGPKRSANILAKLSENKQSIDEFFAMSTAQIIEQFKLPRNVAEAISSTQPISDASKKELSEADLLAEKGIKILKRGTPEYPKRLETVLGKNAPATLYVWGNIDLMTEPSVGFCGSRNASEKGLEVTADAAKQITELGWVVVSGHARGVDTTAHRVAIENGGRTIIVAPEGILAFKLRQELKKIARPDQILIISEFSPKMTWNAGNAMARNRTIIGLSNAMILVEARSEGGTFEAGKTSLALKTPLYVAAYQNPGENAAGNEYFLKRGAKPLKKAEKTGKASISDLQAAVNQKISPQEPPVPSTKTEQLPLLLES